MSGNDMAWFERWKDNIEDEKPEVPTHNEKIYDLGSDFVEYAHDYLVDCQRDYKMKAFDRPSRNEMILFAEFEEDGGVKSFKKRI